MMTSPLGAPLWICDGDGMTPGGMKRGCCDVDWEMPSAGNSVLSSAMPGEKRETTRYERHINIMCLEQDFPGGGTV